METSRPDDWHTLTEGAAEAHASADLRDAVAYAPIPDRPGVCRFAFFRNNRLSFGGEADEGFMASLADAFMRGGFRPYAGILLDIGVEEWMKTNGGGRVPSDKERNGR